jgi:hypothetical protein
MDTAATRCDRSSPAITKSPEDMANHLAFLQIDVSDPEFHEHMLVLSERTEAGYRALLDEAVGMKEIGRCDTARLARAISATRGKKPSRSGRR